MPNSYGVHCKHHSLKGSKPPEPSAPLQGAVHTCPMPPEIRQENPVPCPICGMAPEPETVTSGESKNHELADMQKRFWIGLILTLPVFLLEIGGYVLDIHYYISGTFSNWIQLILATPVVLWAGKPFFERSWASLKTRHLNMFTLITMGTGVTLLKGDLAGIVCARALSVATMRNIRQNLFFAFFYNTAGILYPFFGILLSPIIAAAAMSLSSVSMIANALRLRLTTLK